MAGKRPRDPHAPKSPSPQRTRTGARGRSSVRGANQTEDTVRENWDDGEESNPNNEVTADQPRSDQTNEPIDVVNVSEQPTVSEQGELTTQINASEQNNVSSQNQSNPQVTFTEPHILSAQTNANNQSNVSGQPTISDINNFNIQGTVAESTASTSMNTSRNLEATRTLWPNAECINTPSRNTTVGYVDPNLCHTIWSPIMTTSGVVPLESMTVPRQEEASHYDIRGLTPTYLAIWRLMTPSDKERVQFLRDNLAYVRTEKREEYLNHHFERGQIDCTQYGILNQMSASMDPTMSEMVSQVGEPGHPLMSDIGSDMEADRRENPNLPIQVTVARNSTVMHSSNERESTDDPAQIHSLTVPRDVQGEIINERIRTERTDGCTNDQSNLRNLTNVPNRRTPITTPEFYLENFQEISHSFNDLSAEERIQLCKRKLCWGHITLQQYDELMVIAARISRSESTYAEAVAERPYHAEFVSCVPNRLMGPPPVPRTQLNMCQPMETEQTNNSNRAQTRESSPARNYDTEYPRANAHSYNRQRAHTMNTEPNVTNVPQHNPGTPYPRNAARSRSPDSGAPWDRMAQSIGELVTNSRQNVKKKAVIFGDLSKFTGQEGKKQALSWWHSFAMDIAFNTYSEEEIISCFGTLMERDTYAKNWHEITGKKYRTLAALELAFKSTFGPTEDELSDLTDEIRLKKQLHGQSFANFSSNLVMLNRELGCPYNDIELLKTIYHNMHPALHKEIRVNQFNNLDDLLKLAKTEEEYYIKIQTRKLRDEGVNVDKIDSIEKLHDLRMKSRRSVSNQNFQSQKQSYPQNTNNQGSKNPQIKSNASDDTKKISLSGANNNQSNQTVSKENKPRVKTVFDRTKVKNPDQNLTGFTEDQDKLWPFYNPDFNCYDCGRNGFMRFYCPYKYTIEEAKLNKSRWIETLQKRKERNLAAKSENEKGGR